MFLSKTRETDFMKAQVQPWAQNNTYKQNRLNNEL